MLFGRESYYLSYFCYLCRRKQALLMAETPQTTTGSKPYKLGIALSGGGARGFAHAGALLAIEEAGLKIDVIAGVSAGSVVSVLYAAGVKPLEMANLFAKMSIRGFMDINLGGGGLLKIDKFRNFIQGILGDKKNLEDLEIPVFLGATDLDHGCPAVFSHGEIGPRLIASCSIPIVFKPIEIGGVHYVDGGVLRNHPAWIIRDKCERLIGVNVSPLRKARGYKSIVDVALRTYNLMAKANQSVDMDLCDVSVQTPEIANYAVFDLKHIKQVFLSGYIHTRKALKNAGYWNPSGETPLLSSLPQKE